MKRYCVITGSTDPVYTYTGTGSRVQRVEVGPSFEAKLNAKLHELSVSGAKNVVVDIKPTGPDTHAAYISWGDVAVSATMDVKDAAMVLGFGASTVSRWAHDGKIKAIQDGKRYRIPTSEVDRILTTGQVSA